MKARDRHIPIDQLMALALVARAPEGPEPEAVDEQRALEHVASCERCAAELARQAAGADALREVAFAQADEVFDDAMLDAQRTRVLDRLAHLGQAARVLSFPRRTREVVMPVSSGSRRWISVAAAAGLIIGLVAGQLLHFVPSRALAGRGQAVSMQAVDRQSGPGIVTVSASVPVLTDDELMEEVETSVHVRGAQALRALDALTPTAADTLAVR